MSNEVITIQGNVVVTEMPYVTGSVSLVGYSQLYEMVVSIQEGIALIHNRVTDGSAQGDDTIYKEVKLIREGIDKLSNKTITVVTAD